MENEIKTIREHLGLSRAELAEKLGANLTTIWRWENGKMKPSGPALTALRMMAEAKK